MKICYINYYNKHSVRTFITSNDVLGKEEHNDTNNDKIYLSTKDICDCLDISTKYLDDIDDNQKSSEMIDNVLVSTITVKGLSSIISNASDNAEKSNNKDTEYALKMKIVDFLNWVIYECVPRSVMFFNKDFMDSIVLYATRDMLEQIKDNLIKYVTSGQMECNIYPEEYQTNDVINARITLTSNAYVNAILDSIYKMLNEMNLVYFRYNNIQVPDIPEEYYDNPFKYFIDMGYKFYSDDEDDSNDEEEGDNN